ncbi:30S ribosome-binding factor RbfA [Geminicoccus roseus]|jgi:ribosome-binding factor A|uniref:30S ribosome-binding factor RbfA n=1 Tax=Geminicoccus roseus TaxID=404900 RepID=UPI0004125773|nr:30S ribosome-binding factor RbfA [Geminicoccus roseus]
MRVGEAVRHRLADMFMRRELHDPDLQNVEVTVSEVRMSPDLKQATVFVAELGQDKLRPEVMKALIRASTYMTSRLGREMDLKYAPRLRIVPDETFGEASRVETLIAKEVAALPPRDAEETEE